MVSEVTINLYPIFRLIMLFIIVIAGLLIAYKLAYTHITKKHLKELQEKYPDVPLDFYSKNWVEMQTENNQEIHEINKRIDSIEREREKLSLALKEIKEKLNQINIS